MTSQEGQMNECDWQRTPYVINPGEKVNSDWLLRTLVLAGISINLAWMISLKH